MPDRKAYQGLPAVVEPSPVPPPPRPERWPQQRLEPRPEQLGPPWPWVVEYPGEDGEPMSENEWQARTMEDTFHALKGRFKSDPDIHVAKDLLVYYDESNPNRALAPDVFVTRGVAPGLRSSYRIWEERRPPAFVLEVASRSTAKKDATKKKDLYERWGVREYWLFDPRGGLHEPRLQGFVLVEGKYRDLPARELASGGLAVSSWLLGLELRLEEGQLRLWDVEAEQYLATPDEDREGREVAEERAEAAEEQAEVAVERAAAAEDQAAAEATARRAAEDRAEAAEDRAEAAEDQAEAEAVARRAAEDRAEAAEDQAEAEAVARRAAESRAQAAEARLAELEAALQQPRDPSAGKGENGPSPNHS